MGEGEIGEFEKTLPNPRKKAKQVLLHAPVKQDAIGGDEGERNAIGLDEGAGNALGGDDHDGYALNGGERDCYKL